VSTVARRRVIGLAMAALIFAVDQYVKWLMIGPLRLREVPSIELLPFFDLRWTENYGVSLGMLTATSPEMRWLLVAMTSIIALVVCVWMMRERKLGDILALSLVLGGALGNILDRASKGFVVDYADLHFGTFRPFLIFNIADAAITIGVLIILARSLLSREKPDAAAPKQAADAASES
jgi:signal peptidase II